jgi:AraC-like DNA-binding protein
MKIIRVPDATREQPQLAAGDIAFVDYCHPGGPAVRNRVIFDCYALSFVQHGQKRIFLAEGQTILTPGFGLLIPSGNSIIAEHSGTTQPYQSFVVFFPGQIGRDFLATKPAALMAKTDTPYSYFESNTYLKEYVRHLRTLIRDRQQISLEMARLKVQELLTAMFELTPEIMQAMFSIEGNLSLKRLVENNLLNSLTLEELAFLANRSLSSFKRDFEKAYGLSPQRYIRDRRLEMAATDLAGGKVASEIYQHYGYEYLANFATAFKRKFGVTPADWSYRNKV